MSTTIRHLLLSCLASCILFAAPAASLAAQGDCGQPVSTGQTPTAADCLFILRTAIGALTCNPICVCDTNGVGGATAGDALLCLKKAVGQNVSLTCPTPCGTVTTSTSTTSSSTSSSTSTSFNPTTTTLGGLQAMDAAEPAAPGANATPIAPAPADSLIAVRANVAPQMCLLEL